MSSVALDWHNGLPLWRDAGVSLKPNAAQQRFMRVALLLSTLLHVFLFIHWQTTRSVPVPAEMPEATYLEIALLPASPAPHVLAEPEPPIVLPAPVQIPVTLAEAPPPQPARQSAPVKKIITAQPAPPPAVRPTATAPVAAPTPAPVKTAQASAPIPAVESGAQISHRFLSRVLAHIEAHKFYPLAARRRGIEATVEVSFKLLADGRIESLSLSGGPALLQRAVEQTLQRAAPLPSPPAGVIAPFGVRYGMRFALSDAAD